MDWDKQQVEHMQYLRETNADLSHRLRVAKGHLEYMAKALYEIKERAEKADKRCDDDPEFNGGMDFLLITMTAQNALHGKPTKKMGFNEYQEGQLVRWGLSGEGPGPMDPYDERL